MGLPEWSDDDQMLARALQLEVGTAPRGLTTTLGRIGTPPSTPESGGSDDIGDVSWTVPTVTLRYPANIPGLPGHHWANAVAMSTPIAHKGVVAGARVLARTALETFVRPSILAAARDYFENVQEAPRVYRPLIGPDDPPPTHLNREIMARYRPELKRYDYDETRYETYLDQLGVRDPTLRPDQVEAIR